MPRDYTIIRRIDPPEQRWDWDNNKEGPKSVMLLAETMMDGASRPTCLFRENGGREFIARPDMYAHKTKREAIDQRLVESEDDERYIRDQIETFKDLLATELRLREQFRTMLAACDEEGA